MAKSRVTLVDNLIIDLKKTVQKSRVEERGTLGSLLTDDKSNIIAAINELTVKVATTVGGFFTLDQTVPQTIINGIPLLDTTLSDITNDKHLVTKEYADSLVSYASDFYFNDTPDPIGGIYYQMTNNDLDEVGSQLSLPAVPTGDGQPFYNFITDIALLVQKLDKGIYSVHIHASATNTKNYKIYAEYYYRTSLGVETLLGTSSKTPILTSEDIGYDIEMALINEVLVDQQDRIVVKFYIDASTTGSAGTVTLYLEDNENSRLTIPSRSDVLNQIFVRQDGSESLIGDWDAGAYTITAQKFSADSMQFSPIAAPAHNEGLVFWDAANSALSYYNDEADVTMQLGQENYMAVRNNSGSTIPNGSAVYITGAVGFRPTVDLSLADGSFKSRFVGVATHTIENNTNGYITTLGNVSDVDTSGFTAGDVLYVSPTVAGGLQNTQPSGTDDVVVAGVCLVSNPTNGEIKVQLRTPAEVTLKSNDETITGTWTFNNALTVDGGSVSGTSITNWNTAFSWGDHSLEGYLVSSDLTGYLQSVDINTLSKLNARVLDATLDDSSSPRTPTAHTHVASEITDFDTEVSNNTSVAANTAKVSASGSIETHSDVLFFLAPTNKQVLSYNSILTQWQNVTLSNYFSTFNVTGSATITADILGDAFTFTAGDDTIALSSSSDTLTISDGTQYCHRGTNTKTTIPLLSVPIIWDDNIRTDASFSVSSGEITVNRTGWVEITYTGTAYNSQISTVGRYTVRWELQEDPVGGFVVWSNVPNSRAVSYHRNSIDGNGSAGTTVLVYANSGDKFRLTATIDGTNDPAGDVTAVPDGCSIVIKTTG